jgi:hypothetical protein
MAANAQEAGVVKPASRDSQNLEYRLSDGVK